MDLFESIYKSIFPTEKSILEAVDEYTLYCFYTGYDDLQLGKAYNSPFREDYFPSFSVFISTKSENVEYLWKDHATGESGNIFKLIQRVEQLNSNEEVFQKINEDFALGLHLPVMEEREKISFYKKPTVNEINIRIADVPLTAAGLDFWKQLYIEQDLLDMYHVNQIKWYWSYNEQLAPNSVPDPTFAYRIGKYYQIYSPFAPKQFKFRNSLPQHYFFGYQQLPASGEKVIIDKSLKDVIFCRRLNLNAVAPKSESTPIPEKKMWELKERFTNVYLQFDNDAAGRINAEKYKQKYNWLNVGFLPDTLACKDKTDAVKKIGLEETKKIVLNLLQ